MSTQHPLPEVHRMAHLGHERNEQQSSRVGIDHGRNGAERAGKAGSCLLILRRRLAGESEDRLYHFRQRGRVKNSPIVDPAVCRSSHDHCEGQQMTSTVTSVFLPAKLAILHQTARLQSQPIRCRVRIAPETMPTTVIITIITTKQTCSFAICVSRTEFPRITTQTERNLQGRSQISNVPD